MAAAAAKLGKDAFPLPLADLGHAPSTHADVLSPTVTVSCCWLVTDVGMVGAAELGANDNTDKILHWLLQPSTEVSGNANNVSAFATVTQLLYARWDVSTCCFFHERIFHLFCTDILDNALIPGVLLEWQVLSTPYYTCSCALNVQNKVKITSFPKLLV